MSSTAQSYDNIPSVCRTDGAKGFSKAELNAIKRHQEIMAAHVNGEVTFEVALEDWLLHHAQNWREIRQEKMMALQREEINKYKWIRSEDAQQDLGKNAVFEWIDLYAADWRQWYENEYDDGE